MPDSYSKVSGKVVPGHQVASSATTDARFPGGTIGLQLPYFKKLGLDLSNFYLATLNISIAPYCFELISPAYKFHNVNWTENLPPETFSFSACKLEYAGKSYDAYIYYPHPETKVEHFKDPTIVEIIAPYVEQIGYGDAVGLTLDANEIKLELRSDA